MIELSETIGRLTVHLRAMPIGRDWSIVVHGGDRPHIGAVALASPESPEESCQSICLPSHRESELAQRIAIAIAGHANAAVCVSCGIHLENITENEIVLTRTIIDKLISELFTKFGV
jgi:hypothetical protein